ncbi:MAG: UvrD-helicase domain-containing protein [Candidatus Binatia bacterium]
MSAADTPPIVAEELDLLERVAEALDAVGSTAASPSERSLVQELERLKELLRDGTKAEDQPALLEQWHRHSALLDQLRTSRAQPRVSVESPYFGHLQLREESGDQEILLGKGTHLGGGVAIVDWRHAPVSRLFYRYRQGDAYDEEIAGRERSGEILMRRTVTIRDRRLQRVDSPEGIYQRVGAATATAWHAIAPESARLAGGEGAALRAHAIGEGAGRQLGDDLHDDAARADKHLPDIAGLIDPEQFALITRPTAGFVVIRGAAGSGKTTVALHRIAYLAYDDPRIDSDKTLVVVFSPALRDYVSHVLPALGVHQVQVRTFHEWAREIRRRLLPMLPVERREDTPAVVQRLKLHPALLTALSRHIAENPGPSTAAQVIDDWISVLTNHASIRQALAEVAPDAFGADQLTRAVDWNRRELERVTAYLGGERGSEAELDLEDDALLLRAWQLRVGPLPARNAPLLRYRHVAVDEVQDFSPLEIQVLLGCLDQRKSITLAGDTQQHLLENTGFTSWATFFSQLGLQGAEVNTLEVSYRCSRQVATFAAGVLGPLLEDDTPLRTVREGPTVELFRFADHGACVAFLAEALQELAKRERLASVAVLTPSPELSALYARGLIDSEVPRARQVVSQDFTFAPGVEVTEIEQVKGLEFDYVILVEVSSTYFPDRPGARRLLHVGATRAVHQLWMTTVATPSPLVQSALAEDRPA